MLVLDQLRPHLPQLKAARHRSHGGQTAKRQACELGRARRRLLGRELGDEVGGEGELGQGFDIEEALEPGNVAGVAEERVARGGDVRLAERDEEVQRGRRRGVEGFGVEGDKVKSWGIVSRVCGCGDQTKA